MVGVAVAGANEHGVRLAQAFSRTAGCRLVAVADDDTERLVAVASGLGDLRTHHDPEALLADAEVDAVVMALPTATRSAFARRVLETGRHAFVGKPLALRYGDDEEALVRRVRESGAALLLVAISSPRKARFIHRWRDELGVRFAMGVGGSFDVLAGRTRRAPPWMQRAGLEWLFRLLQEPGRMWRRYLETKTRFAWMLLQDRLRR